jgi:hypothetical protein
MEAVSVLLLIGGFGDAMVMVLLLNMLFIGFYYLVCG